MKKVIVKESNIHGKGTFAFTDIKSGSRIDTIHGPIVTKKINTPKESMRIINWIGVGRNIWIDTRNTPYRYINHSCYPNAAIKRTSLIALDDIKEGDEITIDYSMNDADPLWSIECNCGQKKCRHEIRAIYTVPPDVFMRHLRFMSKTFQRIFLENYILTHETSKGRKV